MPAIRAFQVAQTRVVKVTANNVVDAVRIGNAAFENGQNSDNGVIDGPPVIWGNATTRVRVTDIAAEED